MQNMFAAMGSNASMEHVEKKSSACIEVLRGVAHDVAQYFGLNDFHRSHREVSAQGDLQALLVDLAAKSVHSFDSKRRVPPPTAKAPSAKGRRSNRTRRKTGVRDVLLEGMQMLTHKSLFRHWLERTGKDTGVYDGDAEWVGEEQVETDIYTDTAFDNPEGTFTVDVALDTEDGICPNGDPTESDARTM